MEAFSINLRSIMKNLPTKFEFSQHLHTTFHLHHGSEEAVPLKLIEFKEDSPNANYEQFSLLFRGPNHFVLPQQIYQLKHEHIGEFDMLLVPVGSDRSALYYEAVFHRVIQS
jgi:hypothetical protein